MVKKPKFDIKKFKPVIVSTGKKEKKAFKIDKTKVEELGKQEDENPFEDKQKFSQDKSIDIPAPTLPAAPAPANLENIAAEAPTPAPAATPAPVRRGLYDNRVVNAPQYSSVREGETRMTRVPESRVSSANPGISWVNTTKPQTEGIQEYSVERPGARQDLRAPFERNVNHGEAEIDKDRMRKYQEEQS